MGRTRKSRSPIPKSLAAALLIVSVAVCAATAAHAGTDVATAVSISGSVSGTTRNALGEVIPRVKVTAHRLEGDVDRTVISGVAGKFGLDDLKPGHYQLMASNEGSNSPAAVVEVAAGQDAQVDVIAANSAAGPDTTAAGLAPTASKSTNVADPTISPALAQELAAMKARIDQLETELKTRSAPGQPATAPAVPANAGEPAVATSTANQEVAMVQPQNESTNAPASAAQGPAAPAVDNVTPFAYADWTWLNGNPRNKDAVWDSKFFTPEIRFDTNFVSSFNHPQDDTLGGSTEIFRSNEIQLEQISFGGDFHWQNVRGRVLTLGGMFGVTTPRNDASAGRGQWDLRGAYSISLKPRAGITSM